MVLAEKGPEETFEVLAERGYETLLDYQDPTSKVEKVQEY
jgi:hypothetical protein